MLMAKARLVHVGSDVRKLHKGQVVDLMWHDKGRFAEDTPWEITTSYEWNIDIKPSHREDSDPCAAFARLIAGTIKVFKHE